jgi:predicted acyltransferase
MSNRYASIDFFRGFVITFMLIVNTPGTWEHVFAPLRHADWHGCTPTDLVFPAFLFIIGVSMWFSFEKYQRKLSSEISYKILKRAGLLILMGILMSKFPFYWENIEKWRFPGVLVRLGLCYGIASFLVILLHKRALQVLFVLLLLGYWVALFLHDPIAPYELSSNLVRFIDLKIFGENHIWRGKGIPFDPEGLLSTFPAVCTVLMGWWSGEILQKNGYNKLEVIRKLLHWGVLAGTLGFILDFSFPINKYLWTSSFVLYSGGISMILLAVSVWILEVKEWTKGTFFFKVIGANSLFAFILSGLLVKSMLNITWQDVSKKSGTSNIYRFIYENVFAKIDIGAIGSLLFALTFMLLVWGVCWMLYKRKIFIKL